MLLQVTARSFLGGLALHTGGVLLDDGWLRWRARPLKPVYRRRSGPAARRATGPDPRDARRPREQVRHQRWSGTRCIGGGLLRTRRSGWLPLEMKFSEFVLWSLTDRMGLFDGYLRWPGWA